MTAVVTAERASSSPWRVAFAVPVLRRILASFAVSKIGDLLYATALVVVVLERTGSAGWVSAALIAHMAPAAIVMPFAGVLADRMDRRRLMVLTDTGRLVLMLLMAVTVATGAPVVLLLVLAFLSASVGTPFNGALMGLLPEVLEEDKLPAANAVVQALWSVGVLVGPVVATVTLRAGVLWLPFALNAVTFAVSAALLSGVRLGSSPGGRGGLDGAGPESGDGADAGDGADGASTSFGQEFVEGLRLVLGHAGLRATAVMLVPAAIAWGMAAVLLPLVSRDLLGTGEAGVGLLTAASGLGGVLAAGLASRAAGRDRLLVLLAVGVGVSVVPIAVLSVLHVPLLAYGVQLVDGAAIIVVEVIWMTALQRMVSLRQVARVDSLFMSVSFGCGVLGNVLAPVLVGVAGLRATLVAAFAIGLAGAVVGFVLGSRVATSARDRELLDLLRAVPALDGLEEAGYEALAGAASAPQTLPAGTWLLAAGDRATEVVVLVSGAADVLATVRDGVPLPEPAVVNQVAGPDLLGEIGVLQGRPRTASVVTTSEVVVRRIPAEAFAAVLTGEAVPGALSGTMASRLARWPG